MLVHRVPWIPIFRGRCILDISAVYKACETRRQRMFKKFFPRSYKCTLLGAFSAPVQVGGAGRDYHSAFPITAFCPAQLPLGPMRI